MLALRLLFPPLAPGLRETLHAFLVALQPEKLLHRVAEFVHEAFNQNLPAIPHRHPGGFIIGIHEMTEVRLQIQENNSMTLLERARQPGRKGRNDIIPQHHEFQLSLGLQNPDSAR